MSWAKRQIARARRKKSRGMLNKSPDVSEFECRQAEYLTRYGSGWVRQWWRDHPGMYLPEELVE